MTDHEHRHFSLSSARVYLLDLGPEGRKNLAVVLFWGFVFFVAAIGCGIVIGLLL